MIQNQLPNQATSYWHDSVQLPQFSSFEGKVQVDVGIVGGGITGITAAYLLSQQGMNVCVIDAGLLLNGTTGHTTAKITAQHGLIYDELINHFGLENAAKYYESNNQAHQLIKDLTTKHQISCQLTTEHAYLYTNSSEYVRKLENEYKAYEKLNIDGNISFNQSSLPFPNKTTITMNNQAYFHPLQYLQKLIDICQQNNVQFYEKTRALTIEYNKHPTIITEDDHRIICRYIIQASHYPFYDGTGFYPARMYADRSYILAVKTNKMIKGMYINAETPTRSIRPITINDENMLLIAGENHKTGQDTGPMMKHYEALSMFAHKYFNVKSIPYRWSAQDYTTLDKLPYVGRITKNQHNVFVATGFRKWGMTNGTNAAILLHDLIVGKDNPYIELYAPSRDLKLDPSYRKLFSYNTDVAKHLIKGKLQVPNGRISKLNNDEACITTIDGERTGVYKDNEGKLYAVDTTCTHMGCELQWNNAENTWDCPCHGSRFTYTGDILNGPAVKPLKQININQ